MATQSTNWSRFWMALEISIRQFDDTAIIDLAGDLVTPECSNLHAATKELLQSGPRRVVLNLEKIQRVDQHGLGTLAACSVSALREFAAMAVLAPGLEVQQALLRIRLDQVVQVYESEAKLRQSLLPDVVNPLRSEGAFFLRAGRQVGCIVLWILLGLTLLLVWMEFDHPAALDRTGWLQSFRTAVLYPVSDNSTSAIVVYLLTLVFIYSFFLISLDSHLQGLRRSLLGRD